MIYFFNEYRNILYLNGFLKQIYAYITGRQSFEIDGWIYGEQYDNFVEY